MNPFSGSLMLKLPVLPSEAVHNSAPIQYVTLTFYLLPVSWSMPCQLQLPLSHLLINALPGPAGQQFLPKIFFHQKMQIWVDQNISQTPNYYIKKNSEKLKHFSFSILNYFNLIENEIKETPKSKWFIWPETKFFQLLWFAKTFK